MVTDMVGYSALAQTDEGAALKLLDAHRNLLRPIVQGFLGTEVKTIGDGFLIEFASALEATKCAVEIQRAHRDYNERTPQRRMAVRIGIHVGDVVHSEGDVYGDAVNIASRIEPLAEPGGICISEQIYSQVRNKVDFTVHKLPPQRLKNIEIPLEVYDIVLPWSQVQVAAIREGSKDESAFARLRRVRTGIEELDNEIGGGLPEGTMTLVYGPPKTGKSIFTFHFLMEAVKSSEPCLFIMADYTTEQLSFILSSFGWQINDAREKGLVVLIDTTSAVAGKEIQVSNGSVQVASVADLASLMSLLSTEALRNVAKQGRGFRVVLDSLTPLFIYNQPLIVAKFLRHFSIRMRSAGATGVVTLVDGSVDLQSEIIVKSSVDNLIRLQSRELTVEGMLGAPPVRMAYKITGEGMKAGF